MHDELCICTEKFVSVPTAGLDCLVEAVLAEPCHLLDLVFGQSLRVYTVRERVWQGFEWLILYLNLS